MAGEAQQKTTRGVVSLDNDLGWRRCAADPQAEICNAFGVKRNQRLFVLNAFGADRRRKSDLVFRINTPRVRNIKTHASGYLEARLLDVQTKPN
jgi:hypothetical protein